MRRTWRARWIYRGSRRTSPGPARTWAGSPAVIWRPRSSTCGRQARESARRRWHRPGDAAAHRAGLLPPGDPPRPVGVAGPARGGDPDDRAQPGQRAGPAARRGLLPGAGPAARGRGGGGRLRGHQLRPAPGVPGHDRPGPLRGLVPGQRGVLRPGRGGRRPGRRVRRPGPRRPGHGRARGRVQRPRRELATSLTDLWEASL